MKRTIMTTVSVGLLLLGLGGLGACGGGDGTTQQTAREQAWQELQEAKSDLDAKRAELSDLKSQLAATGAAETMESETSDGETPASGQDLEGHIAELEQEIEAQTKPFRDELVGFINENPVVEGQEPTERQLAALRMKSAEDMLVAQQFIQEAGDYRRAIEIYENALVVDPENPALQEALATAQEMRYMTAERFAQVEDGMTEEEVRALLGPVNYRNVREYPDREVVAWFYPHGPENDAAAGVFFRQDEDGYQVYQAEFEAVSRQGEPTVE